MINHPKRRSLKIKRSRIRRIKNKKKAKVETRSPLKKISPKIVRKRS